LPPASSRPVLLHQPRRLTVPCFCPFLNPPVFCLVPPQAATELPRRHFSFAPHHSTQSFQSVPSSGDPLPNCYVPPPGFFLRPAHSRVHHSSLPPVPEPLHPSPFFMQSVFRDPDSIPPPFPFQPHQRPNDGVLDLRARVST